MRKFLDWIVAIVALLTLWVLVSSPCPAQNQQTANRPNAPAAVAQNESHPSAPRPPEQAPQLSTADKKSLSDIMQHQIDLQKEYDSEEKLKLQILGEWQAAHPGWQIDPRSGAISKITTPPKTEPKK
jgi:hypothetical protein